jgi:phage terminase large subunit
VAWSRLNTTRSAWKARDAALVAGVSVVNFDCIGLGEGIKATLETAETKVPFETNAVAWGAPPTKRVWADGKTSQEKFLNLRAELWWTLRERFRKAFEFVEDGIQHPA